MDTRPRVTPRSYEDFQPSFEWKQDEGSDSLIISLPGFKKDQLRVQMDNLGNLRVSGERPITDERWSRFRKDFRIPHNTSTNDIRAKFENGKLHVILPKLIRKSQPKDQPTKSQEPELAKKSTMEPEPGQGQDQMGQKDSAPSSGKPDSTSLKQSDRKSTETGEDATRAAQTIEEEEKDQIGKPGDKQQPASDTSYNDAELPSFRKRKSLVEDETLHDGGSGMEPNVGGMGMRFKRPRQLVVNVGVAAVILVGLAFYVSYKLWKSIEADRN